ncbi:protein argonaute-4 [Parasteatoda tepidariorum]|uniref:protein argonaute-4 n=1 Tax=Parasteatoda tepidariorum TaxID=114398 RepID=UPI001C71EED3|nr:protein argonaute-4 [Parasteatoda tepidariorum]XP_015905735.2 protein argonaute-4 [Parasteatoda tepidariorum]
MAGSKENPIIRIKILSAPDEAYSQVSDYRRSLQLIDRINRSDNMVITTGFRIPSAPDEAYSVVSEYSRRLQLVNRIYRPDRIAITTGLPAKQAPGGLGRKINLISNLFTIILPRERNIYRYEVKIASFTPDKTCLTPTSCKNTLVNRKIINRMLDTNDNFRNSYAVYDGKSLIYTSSPLQLEFPFESDKITVENENLKKIGTFKVYIKPVESENGPEENDAHDMEENDYTIQLRVLRELFRRNISNVNGIQEALVALETIFRHSPALKYTPIGSNFFRTNICSPLDDQIGPQLVGKVTLFGYHQSLRLGQWNIMTNLDTSATTFFTKQPLVEYIAKLLRIPQSELSCISALRNDQLQLLQSKLKNLKIETYHQRSKLTLKHSIFKITEKNAWQIQFLKKTRTIILDEETQESRTIIERKTVTVHEYFREKYNINLAFPHLPCVQVKPKSQRIYLPIELCYIPEGQHYKNELSDDEKREMIKFTADNPASRFHKIVNIRDKWANYEEDEYLNNFDIVVERDPVRLSGRAMQAPNLNYGNRKIQPRGGSWNIRDLQFYVPSNIRSWILLNLAERHCRFNDLKNFSDQLQRIGRAAGLNLGQPSDIKSIDGSRYVNLHRTLTDARKKQVQLVVVVIPFKDKTIYRNVKQIAEVKLGLQTQCIDHNNARKCNPSLLHNLCLKINAKTGGINHVLTQGEIPKIMAQPVMIIGADVSHAGVTDKSGISVAAVAGSLDMILSRFAVEYRLQKTPAANRRCTEIILELKDMVKALLEVFYNCTMGKKPEKIIFYRDGVSDSYFQEVKEEEVNAVRRACMELQSDYQPAITFVVVQKRHHVRFRPEDFRDGARPEGNVPPGTVADTEIVHPLHRDFYLCSHLGLRGTSRPAHYTVLEDDSEISADDLQKLTYYLCYTSLRHSKSTSAPVPVTYAELTAKRTLLWLSALPEDLREKQIESQWNSAGDTGCCRT